MTDVPYGVLLSGGSIPSLVAACAARFARHRIGDDQAEAWWPRLHSFAIGLGVRSISPPPRSPPRRSAPSITVSSTPSRKA